MTAWSRQGDVLEFVIGDQGDVRLRKLAGRDLGVLRDYAPKEPVTVEEMKRAVRRRARKQAAK